MKIAVVYNRESQGRIDLFGVPNRETIGRRTIQRIIEALEQGGHEVEGMEGDEGLIDRLGSFMPDVLDREAEGLVFNCSYGIQGKARYTHVPSLLEMTGVPYLGSGPLAHSLALDKVVTKMILEAHALPTPPSVVMEGPDDPLPDLEYPLIVKPRNEAMSLGLRVVEDGDALKEAVADIRDRFEQSTLVERFIEGKELYVGILGNEDPVAFEPVEVLFDEGPTFLSTEDKEHESGRTIDSRCPADIPEEIAEEAKRLATEAFRALDCADMARIDFRLDDEGRLYILEVNSLPGLGEDRPFVKGAQVHGLGFDRLINRLVDVAAERYYGPARSVSRPRTEDRTTDRILAAVTRDRDRLEARLADWTRVASRTHDALGVEEAADLAGETLEGLGMRPRRDLTDRERTWTWETDAGLEGGILLAAPIDVPLDASTPPQPFHKGTEWLRGEGVGSSRATLVALFGALQALHDQGGLAGLRIGILLYGDSGQANRTSARKIRQAAAEADTFLGLDPVPVGHHPFLEADGEAWYRLVVSARPRQGEADTLLSRALPLLGGMEGASSPRTDTDKDVDRDTQIGTRASSDPHDGGLMLQGLRTDAWPDCPPHRLQARLRVRASTDEERVRIVDRLDEGIRDIGLHGDLEEEGRRPPFRPTDDDRALAARLRRMHERLEVPWGDPDPTGSTVAAFAPAGTTRIGGLGVPARGLHHYDEAVRRPDLLRRTLLYAYILHTATFETPERRQEAEART